MLHTRGNKIAWLGHAAFRIDTPSGKVILVDPWILTNPLCPEPNKKFERVAGIEGRAEHQRDEQGRHAESGRNRSDHGERGTFLRHTRWRPHRLWRRSGRLRAAAARRAEH